MKKNIKTAIFCALFLIIPMSFASEFIKIKPKKESASHIKEDIVELLESSLRQIGDNIQQSVTVQNQIFDKIKELCQDNQHSTVQLKDLRNKLERNLKKLEDQQADLQTFFICCK